MAVMDELYERLRVEGNRPDADFRFDVEPIRGEVDVLQVTVPERDTLPMFISISGPQLLLIAHLFRDQDVEQSKRTAMLERMLELSVLIPLSSYGKMGELYVVFGAMAIDSPMDDILFEIHHLSENAIEARTAMKEFLV